MTVRVTREAEPQIELYGAYTGELLGGALNTTARLTFTAADDYLIVVPKNDIRRPQLEDGPIPTSYIPTSGSTATRAAETLTIDTPPWPATVEATGTELVTNGTFDTDVSGWTAFSGATLAQVSGEMQITGISANTIQGAYQAFATEVGGIYKISVDLTGTLPANRYIRIGTSAGSANLVSLNQGTLVAGTTTVYFAATTTTTYISIAVFTTGQVLSTDNISVKEITPRGLAIAMDGLVTYADNNDFQEVRLIEWQLDGSNNILIRLRTHSTRTGQFYYAQEASNVGDEVFSAETAYSPGINVPFSIASRHGDNFINGAVDGTALTADLTPTILPDLSSTPIQIGSTFNGFIDTFRVFVEDIGDSGISEASE